MPPPPGSGSRSSSSGAAASATAPRVSAPTHRTLAVLASRLVDAVEQLQVDATAAALLEMRRALGAGGGDEAAAVARVRVVGQSNPRVFAACVSAMRNGNETMAADALRVLAELSRERDNARAMMRTQGLVDELVELARRWDAVAWDAFAELARVEENAARLMNFGGLVEFAVFAAQHDDVEHHAHAVRFLTSMAAHATTAPILLKQHTALLETLLDLVADAADATAADTASPVAKIAMQALVHLASPMENKSRMFRAENLVRAMVGVVAGYATDLHSQAFACLAEIAALPKTRVPLFETPGLVDAAVGAIPTHEHALRLLTRLCEDQREHQIALFQRGGMLNAVMRGLNDARVAEPALALLSQLVLPAPNKPAILAHPKLVDTLLELASREVALLRASTSVATLTSLAAPDKNKLALANNYGVRGLVTSGVESAEPATCAESLDLLLEMTSAPAAATILDKDALNVGRLTSTVVARLRALGDDDAAHGEYFVLRVRATLVLANLAQMDSKRLEGWGISPPAVVNCSATYIKRAAERSTPWRLENALVFFACVCKERDIRAAVSAESARFAKLLVKSLAKAVALEDPHCVRVSVDALMKLHALGSGALQTEDGALVPLLEVVVSSSSLGGGAEYGDDRTRRGRRGGSNVRRGGGVEVRAARGEGADAFAAGGGRRLRESRVGAAQGAQRGAHSALARGAGAAATALCFGAQDGGVGDASGWVCVGGAHPSPPTPTTLSASVALRLVRRRVGGGIRRESRACDGVRAREPTS